MNDSTNLERRYRRLLAFYPKAFRRDHEQEVLSVLMAAAADDQRRPRLAEAVDLLRHAIFMRLRQRQWPSPWEHRHVGLMLPVRAATGIWLVSLTVILYSTGHGGWWGALLVPAAALHFYFAYRLSRPRSQLPS
jgi:hypothetical protein